MPVTCDFCGAVAPVEAPAADTLPEQTGGAPVLPLTWTTAVENGRTRAFCAACSREHLRAIESKLDSEWW